MTYKKRYEAMKKGLGWKTNQKVADAVGLRLTSVETALSKSTSDEDFPKWGKGMVNVYETMLDNVKIVFN